MNKFLLVVLIAFCSCRLTEREIFTNFQAYIKKYAKKYNSINEYMARYRVFSKNMRRVEWSNIKTHGVTKFMDMTPMEFQRKYLNLKISVSDTIRLNNVKPLNVNAPEKWDWRDEGCVNHVKDQGSCGSCWAFASTANMEGQYYLKTKKAITLSEQQLVDCDTIDQGKKNIINFL